MDVQEKLDVSVAIRVAAGVALSLVPENVRKCEAAISGALDCDLQPAVADTARRPFFNSAPSDTDWRKHHCVPMAALDEFVAESMLVIL